MALYLNGCAEHKSARRVDCYLCIREYERRVVGHRASLGNKKKRRHKLDPIYVKAK